MKHNFKNFNIQKEKLIPIDRFIEKALFEPNKGYYSSKLPFGSKGDFITAPTISNLFSEIISVWIVSTWEKLGKPKKFNLVELGPGDGSLAKVMTDTFKKFPTFNKATNIFMYEKSEFLKKIQKKNINNTSVKWITNLNNIKKGPVIFFGNEFFDAIPIKQFNKVGREVLEKCLKINKDGLKEYYKKASKEDVSNIKSYKTLKNLKFIEFPKLGFEELDKIIKKINHLSGGILLIDYGYLGELNKSTLQAVMKNKKIDIKTSLSKNIGKADITSLVNFKLLKEFFFKNNLSVKKIVSQKFFLERMGIIERSLILKKNLSFDQKNYMDNTLTRLLHKKTMGNLFKVIFAFKSKKDNFLGFN